MQRLLLESMVELADPLSLSSAVLAALSNGGSDVHLNGLLPAAIDTLRLLLGDVLRSCDRTVPLAPAAPDASPAQLITAASVAPPQLDRSSPSAWRTALEQLLGDELKILAWRYSNWPGKQRGEHIISASLSLIALRVALCDERVRIAVLADERA